MNGRGRGDGHRRYPLTRSSDINAGSQVGTKNRPATETVVGGAAKRYTMLSGQTYAKDAGRSCSDMPNYCDYAPRFRAEERGPFRGRKPKLRRSPFIQPAQSNATAPEC